MVFLAHAVYEPVGVDWILKDLQLLQFDCFESIQLPLKYDQRLAVVYRRSIIMTIYFIQLKVQTTVCRTKNVAVWAQSEGEKNFVDYK